MMELVRDNWWLFVAALLIGIAVAYWVFVASRRTRVVTKAFDALEEGAGPAKRNQTLIDTPAKPEAPRIDESPALGSAGDDLTRIKGVGPKLHKLLNSLGVSSFGQIAGWSEADIDRIDAQLGTFEGRIRRDSWIEQAKLLSSGDMAAYEDKFGKA